MKKWQRIFNQHGKIDRGSIFIVVILTTLVFAGYLFVGGTLPVELPGTNTNIVQVDMPKSQPQKNSLQLYTFSGSTITPVPTQQAAPDVGSKPIQTIDSCSSNLQGKNESEVIWAYRVANTPASNNQQSLQVFYDDEHTMPLGSVPMKQTPTDHISHPAIDLNHRDGNHFTISPSAFVTDITANANDTSGDAQNGGTPQGPSDVYGSWKPETSGEKGDSSPENGTNMGSGADAWPPSNGPSGNEGHDTNYTAEIIWNVADLKTNAGQPLQAGHTYRVQVAVHDGDQEYDVGAVCFNVTL
jgi:hypothetical protein